MKVSNQEEFNRVNSEISEMISRQLLVKLKDKHLNVNDYRILSRAYYIVASGLEHEKEFKFLA